MKTIYTILFILFLIPNLEAQNPQKLASKADSYYKLNQYAKAIPLYKNALDSYGRPNNNWLSKLANCYKMTNQTEEAAFLYDSIVNHAKRFRYQIYKDYGEVLINQEKYDEAKEMFTLYLESKPEDEYIIQLKENLNHIKDIQPIYKNIRIEAFNYNSEEDDHGAVFYQEGLVFVSDRKRGMVLFKEETGTTGRDFLSLYKTDILRDSTNTNDSIQFNEPSILPRKINMLNKNTGTATFNKSQNVMVFAQNSHIPNKNNEYKMQLFMTTMEDGKWKTPKKLNFCSETSNYMHPALSPDGNTLIFVSDKSRGEGGTDLYISTYNGENWSKPENMGPIINTPAHEGFPFISEDGRLYFCSKGHVGYGGFDIFCSQMDDNIWQKPTNLGAPINSSYDDISFSYNLYHQLATFTSSRDGGDDDIYLFRIK